MDRRDWAVACVLTLAAIALISCVQREVPSARVTARVTTVVDTCVEVCEPNDTYYPLLNGVIRLTAIDGSGSTDVNLSMVDGNAVTEIEVIPGAYSVEVVVAPEGLICSGGRLVPDSYTAGIVCRDLDE